METIAVTVVTLQQEKFTVELGRGEKVARIKQEISKRKGITETSLVVLIDGRWLDGTLTLEESGIEANSRLYAVIGNNGLGQPLVPLPSPPALSRPFVPKAASNPKFGIPSKPGVPQKSPVPFTPTWGGRTPAPRQTAPTIPPNKPGMDKPTFDQSTPTPFGREARTAPAEASDAFHDDLNEADLENIKNIADMGFSKDKVRVAYIAATKNPDRTVEILLTP